MFYYLKVGGPIMIVLAIVSVIALGTILERITVFIKDGKIVNKKYLKELKEFLKNKNYEDAIKYSENEKGIMGKIITKFLKRYCIVGDFKDGDELLREIQLEEMATLEKNIRILGIIAYTSPMLGLLGTVTGMIQAFNNMALKGAGDPNVVAGGISQALLTTAYGLIIAIPAVFAYNIFNGKIEKINDEVEKIITGIVNIVKR